MNGSENTRWVALSALGAAMFAIGLSFAGVACNNTRDVSVTEAARATDSAVVVPAASAATIASAATMAKTGNGAGGSASVTPSPAVTAVMPDSKLTASDAGLKLKRVVVTHKIENHEPTPGDDFTLGNAPVYAFVELDNSSGAARTISVMFENEDTKASVGHVKLSVPAGQPRFRTWGNTRLIRDASIMTSINIR
ncbi:MAG: hypothetical protein ABJB12_02550 [Pseudomonadota bacterium]